MWINLARKGSATLALVLALAGNAWALTDTLAVTVTGTVPLRAEVAIAPDPNSTCTGGAIQFGPADDQDGQTDGSPLFQYAPPRSQAGKNCFGAQLIGTGASTTLSADVTGTVGGAQAAEVLDIFASDAFNLDEGNSGGASSTWEALDSFTRSWDNPIFAKMFFNFRARIRQAVAGPITANVTFTLVST